MITLNRVAIFFVIVSMSCIACNKEDEPSDNAGDEGMLLVGNSFFRPYAENLDVVAADAGYTEHNSTIVIRGGENGWASSFWNDSTTQESLTIKAALDAGGVELFAMTSGGDPTDPIAGHKAWINYALQNYLKAVTCGIKHWLETDTPVHRSDFPNHPWFGDTQTLRN